MFVLWVLLEENSWGFQNGRGSLSRKHKCAQLVLIFLVFKRYFDLMMALE